MVMTKEDKSAFLPPTVLKDLLAEFGIYSFTGCSPQGIKNLFIPKYKGASEGALRAQTNHKEENMAPSSQLPDWEALSPSHTWAGDPEGFGSFHQDKDPKVRVLGAGTLAAEESCESFSSASSRRAVRAGHRPPLPSGEPQAPEGALNFEGGHGLKRQPFTVLQNQQELFSVMNEESKAAHEALKQAATLADIETILKTYKALSIAKTATNTVFYRGNPKASIVLMGEAPGAEEDQLGQPFVGRSGQLLMQAFASIGLDESNLFITNTVYWRPPGNRDPLPVEIEFCRPFVAKTLSIVQPKLLVAVGRVAANNISRHNLPIGQQRGRWFTKKYGFGNIQVTALYHPAYLLRNPGQKKTMWFDLISLNQKVEALSKS